MRKKVLLLLALCTLCLLVGSAILAAPTSSGGFAVPWWTVDGGGHYSGGATFSLRGTSGQADAGRLSGGVYELSGGFWNNGIPSSVYRLYLPALLR